MPPTGDATNLLKPVEDLAAEQLIPQAGIELSIYGACTLAKAGLSRNLAVQRGPDGISANAVSPGMIETEVSPLLSQPDFMARRIA